MTIIIKNLFTDKYFLKIVLKIKISWLLKINFGDFLFFILQIQLIPLNKLFQKSLLVIYNDLRILI